MQKNSTHIGTSAHLCAFDPYIKGVKTKLYTALLSTPGVTPPAYVAKWTSNPSLDLMPQDWLDVWHATHRVSLNISALETS